MHLNKSLKPKRWIFNAFSKCCNLTLDFFLIFFFFQIWTIDVKVVIASVASLLNNWFYILRKCTSFVLCKIPPDQCNNNLCLCPAIKNPQKRDKSIFHFLSSLHVSENMHNMHWYFASTSCFVLVFFFCK